MGAERHVRGLQLGIREDYRKWVGMGWAGAVRAVVLSCSTTAHIMLHSRQGWLQNSRVRVLQLHS